MGTYEEQNKQSYPDFLKHIVIDFIQKHQLEGQLYNASEVWPHCSTDSWLTLSWTCTSSHPRSPHTPLGPCWGRSVAGPRSRLCWSEGRCLSFRDERLSGSLTRNERAPKPSKTMQWLPRRLLKNAKPKVLITKWILIPGRNGILSDLLWCNITLEKKFPRLK